MKIAMAQINPTIADIAGNREMIISCIGRAESLGADLVVFPEMATLGYPPMDLLENRKLIDDNLASIEEIARRTGSTAVICGYVDTDPDNPPMLFNAAAFMHEGKVMSRHFKTLLPTYDVFDELRYFSRARSVSPVEFRGHRIGVTICEDIWNDIDFYTAGHEAGSLERFDYRRRYEVDRCGVCSHQRDRRRYCLRPRHSNTIRTCDQVSESVGFIRCDLLGCHLRPIAR